MRIITKVLGAVAVAGLAAAGGTISTASNTLPASIAGYGESVVTGATVQSINYTPDVTDSQKLASVTFSTTTDITGLTATLRLTDSGVAVGSPVTCVNEGTETPWLVTCTVTAKPAFEAFDAAGLTVE